MTDTVFAAALENPVVLTAIAAAVVAVVTVRAIAARGAKAGDPAAGADVAPASIVSTGPLAPAPTSEGDAAIVAVISAAIHTVSQGKKQRIIYVGEARSGGWWTGQTRARHHASHTPRS